MFQYTPPWGGERIRPRRRRKPTKVSIHASVRRRTELKTTSLSSDIGFNTRLREEANLFQVFHIRTKWICFNTRLREEANSQKSLPTQTINGFQYTPPWGGEPIVDDNRQFQGMFQYTPPWGGELNEAFTISLINSRFNTRLREEANSSFWRFLLLLFRFNTRLREEANWNKNPFTIIFICFNTRLREEANKESYTEEAEKKCFNTRLREEANLYKKHSRKRKNKFQYTPPWGGELILIFIDSRKTLSFNTRLREEANTII